MPATVVVMPNLSQENGHSQVQSIVLIELDGSGADFAESNRDGEAEQGGLGMGCLVPALQIEGRGMWDLWRYRYIMIAITILA